MEKLKCHFSEYSIIKVIDQKHTSFEGCFILKWLNNVLYARFACSILYMPPLMQILFSLQ